MTRSRFTTIGVLTAIVAVATGAGAQSTALQLAPTAAASSMQELLAKVQLTNPMVSLATRSNDGIDLIAESAPTGRWGAIKLHEPNASNASEPDDSSSAGGFFGSTKGRLSLVGIAGLAGASYFALQGGEKRSDALSSPVSPSTGPSTQLPGAGTVAFAENPEPATIALMTLGLGAIGLVARRRRNS